MGFRGRQSLVRSQAAQKWTDMGPETLFSGQCAALSTTDMGLKLTEVDRYGVMSVASTTDMG